MAKRRKRPKKRRKISNFLKKELTEEEKIVRKIREEAKKEKKYGEEKRLANKIKEKWEGFIKSKTLERKIKERERERDVERRKKMLPDDGFGD